MNLKKNINMINALEQINDYCEQYTSSLGEVLNALERETHLKTLQPVMLSGPLLGRFLTEVSNMLRPDRILEIGTFTGYSAICLAQGLPPTGELHTIEINPERESIIKKYLELAGLSEKVQLILGDALEVIPTLNDSYDLVFMDAKKLDYLAYYNLIFPHLKLGGYMVVDNVLWSGKVMEENPDPKTQAIIDFCDTIKKDKRVSQSVFPIRDGVMLIRKEHE
jgi:predicted O-methyltransferase YrrM